MVKIYSIKNSLEDIPSNSICKNVENMITNNLGYKSTLLSDKPKVLPEYGLERHLGMMDVRSGIISQEEFECDINDSYSQNLARDQISIIYNNLKSNKTKINDVLNFHIISDHHKSELKELSGTIKDMMHSYNSSFPEFKLEPVFYQ